MISSDTKDNKGDWSHSSSAVFNPLNQEVIEIELWDYKADKIYRWIKPGYKAKHHRYARSRGFNPLKHDEFGNYNAVDARKILKLIEVLTDRLV